MGLKWVNRQNEEEQLNRLYRKIVNRENKYHIAEESSYIREKESIFKKIASGENDRKKSKLRQRYEGSWLNDQVDEIKDDISDLTRFFIYYLKRLKFLRRDFRVFAANHGKQFFIGIISLLLITVGIIGYTRVFGYEVIFNGQRIGKVRNINTFEQAMKNVDANLSKWYDNSNVYYEKSVTFERAFIHNQKDIMGVKDCEQAFYNLNIPLFCRGAVIKVNGVDAVRVASVQDAKAVIQNIGNKYEKESRNVKLVRGSVVKEKLTYEEKYIAVDSTMSVDKAIAYLSDPSKRKAKNVGTSNILKVIDSSKENTNLVSALNFRNDEFSTGKIAKKPSITITTVKQVTAKKDVAYKTVYRDDSSLKAGSTKVKREGQYGKKRVTSLNTYENGSLVKKKITNEKIIKKPTTKIVSRGTKPLPPITGSGRFLIPCSGQISALNKAGSHAGYKAVDIANSSGTNIYASETGIVSRAGYFGGYGLCVDIDHGNGYSTRYGHNSELLVKVGQRVQQGEVIAHMGSTGHSTGPHCHFEIHINGVSQVILNYFSYLQNGMHVEALQK